MNQSRNAALPVDDRAAQAFPTFAAERVALLRRLVNQLDRTQWLTGAALRARQRQQLSRLLRYAGQQVPHYRAAWAEAGVAAEVLAAPEHWSRLPILTRQQVQALGARLRSSRPLPAHGPLQVVRTSGSTGRPVEVTKTALAGLIWQAVALRDHAWQRRDLRQTMATIRIPVGAPAAYPDGRRARDWGMPAALLYRTGPSALLDVTTAVHRQLEWLVRQRAGYLLTYPSNALALARAALAADVPLPGLREVRVIGESSPDALRDTVRAAWAVGVTDIYSTQEVGYIAIQCPANPDLLHTQDETVLVEVLDEQQRPCRPGAVGRVVVTPLHNFAMPLVRYEVGDYARVAEACPCGRGLGGLSPVLGRVRNMLRLPGGGVAWPRFGSSRFFRIAPIDQYQFIQTAPDRIVARIASPRPLTATEQTELERVVRENVRHPFVVEIEQVEEIPRAASGKFEEFVCALDNPPRDGPY